MRRTGGFQPRSGLIEKRRLLACGLGVLDASRIANEEYVTVTEKALRWTRDSVHMYGIGDVR